MNIIEDAVIDKLLATTAVTNVVGQRIYPRMAPQTGTKPYLVINKLPNEQQQQSHSGVATVTISYVSVSSWGTTYKEAVENGGIADAAINAIRGLFGASVFVSFCLRQDGYDQSQLPTLDDETGNPGYRLIYKICHAA